MISQNEDEKRKADSVLKDKSLTNPIRPNLADSTINQKTQDLEKTPNEHDPEKEYIAGEQEGDFPPDIKMNESLAEGSEFDTDQGTIGQQSIKDQQQDSGMKNQPQH